MGLMLQPYWTQGRTLGQGAAINAAVGARYTQTIKSLYQRWGMMGTSSLPSKKIITFIISFIMKFTKTCTIKLASYTSLYEKLLATKNDKTIRIKV